MAFPRGPSRGAQIYPDRRSVRARVAVRLGFRDLAADRAREDRKSVVSGKSVSVRVDLGGRRIIKKKRNSDDTSLCVYGLNPTHLDYKPDGYQYHTQSRPR